ncbi:MAG: GNAT family N-acetyltransferase, partial [Pseudomonadota bacterium]
ADGWRIGAGGGGGKRVSAARALAETPDIAAMERAQEALGQPPLVMVRSGMAPLDQALDERGYGLVDPTVGLVAPLDRFPTDLPRLTAFEVAWPPLGFQREIWAQGGVSAERIAVMERVSGPHATLLGRTGDRPSATAFVAATGRMAMLHALEVLPEDRRCGLGRTLMIAAARWARRQGADALCVLVTRSNTPALALYRALGMTEVTGYHYRLRREMPG